MRKRANFTCSTCGDTYHAKLPFHKLRSRWLKRHCILLVTIAIENRKDVEMTKGTEIKKK